jgi:hypothetical protein
MLTQRDNAISVTPNTANGLGVRLLIQMQHCEAEIVLGDDVFFMPTQESLDTLARVSLGGHAFIAYE